MYVIVRKYTPYAGWYWTGTEWTKKKSDAKQYVSQSEAYVDAPSKIYHFRLRPGNWALTQ